MDADDVCAGEDNCPALSNPNQADEDGDGIGDLCDEGEGSTGAGTSSGGLDDTGPGPGPDTDETGLEPTTGVTPETGSEGSDGSTGDTAGQSGDGGGCACSSGRAGTRGSAWWLALLVGAGLRRRRRAA